MKKQLSVGIGGRVRKARKALGYSRETLAEKTDLASSFIGTIELGAGSLTAETLIKLCRTLGTSADYILSGREEQGDLTAIRAMLFGLDSGYLPYVEELLGAYVKSPHLSEQQAASENNVTVTFAAPILPC